MHVKRIDHVGIIVADLEAAKEFFGNVLGLPVAPRSPEAGVKSAFYRCGETDIQVLQIDDPAVRKRRLGEGNVARFEHIALDVDRLEPVIERLQAAGVEMASPAPHVYVTKDPGKPEGQRRRGMLTTEKGGLGIVLQLRDTYQDGH